MYFHNYVIAGGQNADPGSCGIRKADWRDGDCDKKFRIWEVCNISEIKREVDEYIESIGQYSTYTENEPNSSYGLTPKMPTLLKLNQSDTE